VKHCALLVTVAALASGIVASSQARPGGQPAVFRSRVDGVSVDVSVRSGGQPVGGLAAKDFVLFDNDVRQQIEMVDAEAVPLDVSLLIDTSGSTAELVEQLKSDMRRIASLLRPDDRLRLLTIDAYVNEIFPMQPAAGHPEIGRMTVDGLTSLYDSLAASMLRPVEPTRRHLVIALTDGIDTISVLDGRALRDVAQRSDATLHIGHLSVDAASSLAAFQCQSMGWCSPFRRFWVPFQDRDISALKDAARLTGGDLYEPGFFESTSPVSVFARVFDEFRRSYVLRFTPRGVAAAGWHELTVRVPASPSYVVRARKGYANGVSGPPVGAEKTAPIWARSDRRLPPAVDSIVAAYDHDDYQAAASALWQLRDPVEFIRDFKAAGNPWPANPRREAAFVIEIADAALYRHDAAATGEALSLLQSYHPLIRNPLGPDGFERLWYWAELTAIEGLVLPGAVKPFVTNAQKRFPDEPRFVLASAIVSDQAEPVGAPDPVRAAETLLLYDAALQSESTFSEARLRKAYLLHRLGGHAGALALLDTMRAPEPDRMLLYLSQLLRGHFHDALGHANEGEKAYRAALQIWPGTQAPRVGLMTLLFRNGDRHAAEQMAETIQAAADGPIDPWWLYWRGDYRLYPAAIAALREGAR
jgi:VWFA-related protein